MQYLGDLRGKKIAHKSTWYNVLSYVEVSRISFIRYISFIAVVGVLAVSHHCVKNVVLNTQRIIALEHHQPHYEKGVFVYEYATDITRRICQSSDLGLP